MLQSAWPNAIAHVDADCFYASCEQLRRPDLKGRPICVLSSQDACIVAKTYDAKAAGIKTGMTVWEARKLLAVEPGRYLLRRGLDAVLHRPVEGPEYHQKSSQASEAPGTAARSTCSSPRQMDLLSPIHAG